MSRIWPLWAVVVFGATASLYFAGWSWIDFGRLQGDYAEFHHLVATGAPLRDLFVAESEQNIHRINVLAEGVWALLSLVISAIGLLGLCLAPRGK